MASHDLNHESKSKGVEPWAPRRAPIRLRAVCLATLVLLIIGLGVWLWRPTAGLDDVLESLQRAGPISFFAALVLLPLIGLPTTPFHLLAGPAFGPGVALVGTALAIALQQALAYGLASRWLRDFIKRLLARTRWKVPVVQPENHARFTFLVRIAPGVPSWSKNYLVGLAGIPFPTYFWISWPISVAYAAAFILVGDAAFTRDWRELIPSVVLLVLLIFLRYRIRLRSAQG
jgi:uncharacterized membrane protein YdjX (TVP38/TMEM64 family)